MAATCSRTCPISTLDLIDWVSPTKAVYMSEAAKAIDFYHNGGMFTQRCESYGEAGDRHGAAGRPFCTAKLCRLHAERAAQDRNVVAPRPDPFTLPFKRADAFMASFNVAKSAVNNTRAA
jgi:endogenous inhibitor of DNA gyrase (YacG/DUF329 family)